MTSTCIRFFLNNQLLFEVSTRRQIPRIGEFVRWGEERVYRVVEVEHSYVRGRRTEPECEIFLSAILHPENEVEK